MNREKRRRLLACLMILAMLCTMLPTTALATEGSAGGAAGAEATVTGDTYSVTADSAISDGPVEISGPINTSQTWNDGDTVTGAVTITGGSDEANPVVITVTGSVNVQETVSVTGGYVKFTGGGTLLRNVANKDMITIGAGGTLELENITLDGDKDSFGSNNSPLIRINNTAAALVMNDGAVIQNHANTTAMVNNGGTVLIAYGSFTMNGGRISGNQNPSGVQGDLTAVILGSAASNSCSFTMSGGTIADNLSDTQEVALYIISRNATVRLLPKAAILLQGALAKSSSASSKNVTIAPVEGYGISSVTVDGSPRDAGPDGTYTISGFSTGLSVGVSTDPGSEPEPAAPVIGAQPASGTYSVGDDVTLSIVADTSDGGTLSYQWYSNTTDSAEGGAPIDGAASPSYTPPTDTPGTTYYYCVVTSTLDGQTATAVSSVAAVEVSAEDSGDPESAAVYLNGASGDDANDGATAETPVKTFERAKELLDPDADGATIYITGRVTITGTETWSLEGYTNAKVQRASTFSGSADRMIQVGNNGNLTLEDIVIDGNKDEVPNLTGTQAIVYIADAAGVVTINEGTVLRNNNAQKGGAIAFNNPGTLNIYGGTMTAPDDGDTIYNNGVNKPCTIHIYPTSLISIEGSWGAVNNSNCTAVIVPQPGYETTVTANDTALEPGQDGTYTVAAVASEGIPKISSGLVINTNFDAGAPVVYLNGASGDDQNSGADAANAVKTFAKAKELLSPAIDGATIYVTGQVSIADAQTWSLEGYTNAKVQRHSSNIYSNLITVSATGSLTLEHIVLDGNKEEVPTLTVNLSLIIVSGSSSAKGTLTIKEGAVLQNNNAPMGGAISFTGQPGILNIYGGTITGPDAGTTIHNYINSNNRPVTINIYPTSDISISGSWGHRHSSGNSPCSGVIYPQDQYEITSIEANSEPLTPAADGTYKVGSAASEGVTQITDGLEIRAAYDLEAPVRPEITGPVSASYTPGGTAEPLTVTATVTDGGELSYQWYSNTTDSAVGGSLISGAIEPSYTPSIEVPSLTYYYCVVTNTKGAKTVTATSGVAAVDSRIQLNPPALSSTPEAVLSNSITLAAPAPSEEDAGAAIQYRRSTNPTGPTYGNWQSNRVFTGLAASTDYYFQAQYVAANTATYRDSEPSEAVLIKTDAPLQDLWICTNAPANPRYTYSVWVNGELKGEHVSPTDQSIISGTPSSPKIAKAGDTVKFIPYFAEGYGVGSFTVQEGGIEAPVKNLEDGSYSFTMPAQRVKIRIIAGVLKTVAPAPEMEHGSITISGAGPDFVGGYITVTAAPDPGYILKSVAHSVDGGGSWSISNVTITGANTATIFISHFDTTTGILVKAEFEELAVTERAISSEAELRAFAEDVNAGNDHRGVTVTLTDDIPLTAAWTPIGTKSAPFKGTFNGAGHAVTGLNVYYDEHDEDTCYLGLFGYVNAAVIENLTVSGTVTATDKAANYVSKDTSTVSAMTRSYVGGIVGTADNETQIKNCVSSVDVTACRSTIGGIAGDISKGYISDCINYGAVTSSKRNFRVGGIAGDLSGNMERCGNYGDVTVTEETTTQWDGLGGGVWLEYEKPWGEAGGLVGWLDPVWSSSVSIDSSFNRGNVVGWAYNIGGLVGYVQPRDGTTTAVTNCYNTGTVSMTAKNDVRGGGVVPVAGLVGDVYKSTGGLLKLTNCYNAGALSQSAGQWGKIDPLYNAQDGANVTVSNCHPAGAVPEASVMGDKYQPDVNAINGGNPLLSWESNTISEERYNVTFAATPAEATVRVFSDEARTQEITAENGVFSLQMGQYFYAVSAAGYVTETGSFNVTLADRTISVTLRAAANVTFTVTPATADFMLTRGSEAVAPVSSADGVHTFALYAGDGYIYTATAGGYNGVTREYVANDGDSITVTLTPSGQSEDNPTVTGGQTISAGGVYNLGRVSGASQGVITISTADPVTLIGTGVSLTDAYENLYIKCTVAGVNLTLQDLYISNTLGATNMIDFMGADNELSFAGVSILDMNTGATGYAMFHVGQGTELTVGGVTPDDTLYFYKREQGAGIGGNQGEYNGKVTITGGNLFMKNSKQGALIGSGANAKSASGSPGDIIIEDGILNLIPISRGAAIGGSAGSAGGATGTNVYIRGGTLTINVDFSGSAIGGGGFAEGNDSDGGILYYAGGSIRTFIDHNAAASNLWPGVTTAGVNDVAVTAEKLNAGGENVYLLTFDTSRLSTQADSFTVEDDGETIYTGGLHTWRYINEDLYKDEQIAVNYTIDNWAPLDDPNLYLYLTGEDHTLTVNGEEFNIRWDSAASTFTVEDAAGPGETPPTLIVDTTDNTVGQAVEITFTDDEAWRSAISGITVNGTALTGGQYTVSAGVISIDAAVFNSAGEYTVTVTAGGYANATVTQTINEATTPGDNPKYTLAPVADESVYEVGETGGIKTMTVKTGVTGLKYFGTLITPVVEHEGQEAVVFTHLRDGIQLSLNITKTDFDLVDQAKSGFNVEAGDVVKVFIMDDLNNDEDFNPTLLQ